MQTFLLFLLAGAVTLFFLRGNLKGLAHGANGGSAEAKKQAKGLPCTRCTKTIPEHYGSCPHCGKSVAVGAA